MKKYLFAISFVLVGLAATAQFSIAPKIGVGMATSSATLTGRSLTSKPSVYVEAGAEVRYHFYDFLSLESGLTYQYSTQKLESSLLFFSSTTTSNLHYINIPLEIVYRKNKGGIYGGAGVNFGLGIFGNQNVTSTFGTPTKTDIAFDGKDNSTATDSKTHLKLLNTGINIKAGYSFEKFFLGANACIGLSDLVEDATNSVKTTTVGIHAGIVFGGKKKAKK